MRPSQEFVDIESVDVKKAIFQELPRDLKTDEAKVCRRGEIQVRELVDIESEFRSNVTVRAFPYVTIGPNSRLRFGNSTATDGLMACECPIESPK